MPFCNRKFNRREVHCNDLGSSRPDPSIMHLPISLTRVLAATSACLLLVVLGEITASAATLSATSLTFAGQLVGTTSSAQAVTLTNSGTTALPITSVTIAGTNATDFAETNNCGTSLAAGAKCSLSVTFKPSAVGSRTAKLSIVEGSAISTQNISLSGTGASAVPGLGLSTSSLSFGNVADYVTSSGQTITLTNTGGATLTISSRTVTGTNAADFLENSTCGTSLAAGAKCTVVILFTPHAAGARSAALSIADNASGSPQSVKLSGTGVHDVMLSWSGAGAGYTGYSVYRGTVAGSESKTALNATPISGTSYTDATVTAGATYYYTVMATGSGTTSMKSNEAKATVPSP